jgi:FG-GAP-like repeat
MNRKTLILSVIVFDALVVLPFVVWLVYFRQPAGKVTEQKTNPLTANQIATMRTSVETFCADCHANPLPETFPEREWYKEVKRGFDFYEVSDRMDMSPPPLADVVKFYRQQAPADADFLRPLTEQEYGVDKKMFVTKTDDAEYRSTDLGVAHVKWTSLNPGEQPVMLYCDMYNGTLGRIGEFPATGEPDKLGQLRNAAHVEVVDLDLDGRNDLLVADIGNKGVTDDLCGRVVWLKQLETAGTYEPIVLIEKIGRACDAQAVDFDGDGDLDIIVAEFGWQKSGRISLLRNVATDSRQPKFVDEVIDPRHGTVGLKLIDLNKDNKMDFVALIAQEHEVLEAFINQGDGSFKSQTWYEATMPSYGSSGFVMEDLDKDGDQDVIYTNGDSFDSSVVKPYHSIQWLENVGDWKWERHHVVLMPGVHRASPFDFDGDGDLDIVACSLLPSDIQIDRSVNSYPSVLYLENNGRQEFTSQVLESGDYCHPTCELGDFDHDGDMDFAVGNASMSALNPNVAPIKIWWNQKNP